MCRACLPAFGSAGGNAILGRGNGTDRRMGGWVDQFLATVCCHCTYTYQACAYARVRQIGTSALGKPSAQRTRERLPSVRMCTAGGDANRTPTNFSELTSSPAPPLCAPTPVEFCQPHGQVKMQRLVSKAEECGGTRQEWLDCLREIVEVGVVRTGKKSKMPAR